MPLVTERFAFYHCPRTGGTYVRSVLQAMGIKFRLIGHFHDTPQECPVDQPFFTFARNHDDWLDSWRGLVRTNPGWAWPVQEWLFHETASEVFSRYSAGAKVVGLMERMGDSLSEILGMFGYSDVPTLPKVNARAW